MVGLFEHCLYPGAGTATEVPAGKSCRGEFSD